MGICLGEGQSYFENRSLGLAIPNMYRPFVFFYDFVTYVETQAGSAAHLFCGKKGFENISPDGFRDSRTGVLTPEHHLLAFPVVVG